MNDYFNMFDNSITNNPVNGALEKNGWVLIILGLLLSCYSVAASTGVYAFIHSLYIFNIIDYIAFVSLFVYIIVDKSSFERLILLGPYCIVVVCYYVVSLVSSQYTHVLWKIVIHHIVILSTIMFSISAVIHDKRSLKFFAYLIQIAAIIHFVICIAEIKFPGVASFLTYNLPLTEEAIDYHSFRPGGLLRNPNDLATFFIFSFLMAHWSPAVLRYTGRLISVFGVYLTASRGGFIILLISIVFCYGSYFLHSLSQRKNILKYFLLSSIMLIFMVSLIKIVGYDVFAIKSDSGQSRIERMISFSDSNGISDRLRGLSYWLPKALDAPFYGNGLYSFQLSKYSKDVELANGQGPHNMWVMLLGEIGPIGPVLYFIILATGMWRIMKIKEHPNDRMVLLLLWFMVFVMSLKGHNQLEDYHWVVMVSFIQLTPWLNKFGFLVSDDNE